MVTHVFVPPDDDPPDEEPPDDDDEPPDDDEEIPDEDPPDVELEEGLSGPPLQANADESAKSAKATSGAMRFILRC